jgi:hypothetical protein
MGSHGLAPLQRKGEKGFPLGGLLLLYLGGSRWVLYKEQVHYHISMEPREPWKLGDSLNSS